jgi:hypothetical protein
MIQLVLEIIGSNYDRYISLPIQYVRPLIR